MQEVVLAVIGLISAAAAGGGIVKLFDFLANRAKANREAEVADRDSVVREYNTFLGELRGEIHALRGQLNEVTAKHEICQRANSALTVEVRQLQARLAEVSTGGGDAIIVTDPDGKVLAWNAEAAVIFGYSGSEAIGRNLTDLIIPEEYVELHRAAMVRWRTEDRPPRSQPLVFRAKDRRGGIFPIDVSLNGWKTGDKWHVTATIRRRSERFD